GVPSATLKDDGFAGSRTIEQISLFSAPSGTTYHLIHQRLEPLHLANRIKPRVNSNPDQFRFPILNRQFQKRKCAFAISKRQRKQRLPKSTNSRIQRQQMETPRNL